MTILGGHLDIRLPRDRDSGKCGVFFVEGILLNDKEMVDYCEVLDSRSLLTFPPGWQVPCVRTFFFGSCLATSLRHPSLVVSRRCGRMTLRGLAAACRAVFKHVVQGRTYLRAEDPATASKLRRHSSLESMYGGVWLHDLITGLAYDIRDGRPSRPHNHVEILFDLRFTNFPSPWRTFQTSNMITAGKIRSSRILAMVLGSSASTALISAKS